MATGRPFSGIYLRVCVLLTTATAWQHGNRKGMEVARMGDRETLEAARDAAIEARRTRRQLRHLDKDGARRVPELYRASLHSRLDLCKCSTDRGRDVLDAMEGAGIAVGWVLDAMRLYYVDALTWHEVGKEVAYSACYIRRVVTAALDAADADR